MAQLLTLDDVAATDPNVVGGKAATLARLRRAGVPVPDAIMIPVAALTAHLEGGMGRTAAQQAEAVLGRPMSPALAGDLRTRVAQLGPLLAVRSSAPHEDGEERSFAGQYDSIVGVRPGDETEAAVLQCWASAFNPRAVAYRKGEAPQMAVLIQPLVRARASGVMFTINPVNGAWNELIVEAVWGLGDSLMAGAVAPDHVVVGRPRRRWSLQKCRVLRLDPREQTAQRVIRGTRLSEVPVPQGLVNSPKLRSPERLAKMGLAVERLFRGPQDIEWAQDEHGAFTILQSRPITTTKVVRPTEDPLWTRRFLGERWTEPATPLGWSEVQDLLHHFIAYPKTARRYLGGEQPTRLVRFAPYLNATVFRHLAFKLPGAPPPRFMLELLPPGEADGWMRRWAQSPDIDVYRSILSETWSEQRWRRFRWNPWTNWRRWEAFATRLVREVPRLNAPIADRGAAMIRVEQCRRLAREYIGIHVCSLLFANLFYELGERGLQAAGMADQASQLLLSDTETATVRVNQDLWRLSQGEMAIDSFLELHGHRAQSSWELFSQRWAEDPAVPQALAHAMHQAPPIQTGAPVPRGLAPPLRSVLRLARRYLSLREDQRYAFDQLLFAWKQAMLVVEQELGLEVRFLERGELDRLQKGDLAEAASIVARRKEAWQSEVARRDAGDEPPDFLTRDPTPVQSSAVMRGLAVSSGVALGPARVVRTLEQSHALRAGEVLVVRTTDPAWTPMFGRAAGLVLELGGMLSHGAVVAREYHVPAVANITGATKRISNGQTVRVDGTRGVVSLP